MYSQYHPGYREPFRIETLFEIALALFCDHYYAILGTFLLISFPSLLLFLQHIPFVGAIVPLAQGIWEQLELLRSK